MAATTFHSVIKVFWKETAFPVEKPWTGVRRGTLFPWCPQWQPWCACQFPASLLWLSHATHLLFLWQTDRGCGRWPTWCTYYYHTVIFPEFRLHSHIVISPASEVLRRRRVLSDSASGWHGEQIIGVADNIFVVADERINDSAVVAPCACATTSEPPGCT